MKLPSQVTSIKVQTKLVAIKEARDVTALKRDDLMGSLQTFEMNMAAESRDKRITLKAETNVTRGTYTEDEISMLTRNLGKFLKRTGKSIKPQMNKRNDNREREGDYKQMNDKSFEKRTPDQKQKSKGIQSRECESFVRIQAECGNTLKKKVHSILP